MSSTESRITDTDTYTAHELVEDIQGLYSSDNRIYSSHIEEGEFNTLDAMNQLRSEYEEGQKPERVDQITGESDWDELENLLTEAVDEGLLDRETKKVDLPSETYPRKNLFYQFKTI